MKIVVTDAKTITNGDISLEYLKKYGDVEIYGLTDASQTAERIADADMVIVNKTVLDRENMKNATNLKYIGLFATGYNNIDIEYAKKQGIAVCNAGSYSTNAVAQQVFSYVLAHSNRTADYDAFVRSGGWKKSETFSPFVFPINELDGKVIGIVGYGSIGKKVAEIARVFGMKVLAYTRTPKEDANVRFCSLDELLENSDYVTVHCPLNQTSNKMFGADAFKKMKMSCMSTLSDAASKPLCSFASSSISQRARRVCVLS